MKNCFPISALNAIKNVPEVCRIFCATANPTTVLVAESSIDGETGRGIVGVVDGPCSSSEGNSMPLPPVTWPTTRASMPACSARMVRVTFSRSVTPLSIEGSKEGLQRAENMVDENEREKLADEEAKDVYEQIVGGERQRRHGHDF